MTEELEHKFEVEIKEREGRQKLPDPVKEELKASGMMDEKVTSFQKYYKIHDYVEPINKILDIVFIEQLGMNAHYQSMSRGVLDIRDIIYFLSITIFFIMLTKLNINKENK